MRQGFKTPRMHLVFCFKNHIQQETPNDREQLEGSNYLCSLSTWHGNHRTIFAWHVCVVYDYDDNDAQFGIFLLVDSYLVTSMHYCRLTWSVLVLLEALVEQFLAWWYPQKSDLAMVQQSLPSLQQAQKHSVLDLHPYPARKTMMSRISDSQGCQSAELLIDKRLVWAILVQRADIRMTVPVKLAKWHLVFCPEMSPILAHRPNRIESSPDRHSAGQIPIRPSQR